MKNVQVTGLYIYPVKSMRGISLEQTKVSTLGLADDRRLMVVRENGRFVTQRDLPQLALIQTSLADDGILLEREGFGSISVLAEQFQGALIKTKVWKDFCDTIDQGDEVSHWLTIALQSNETLRLVCMAPGYIRPQGQAENLGHDTTTVFADAAPLLVASEASLNALNQELVSRGHSMVPMDRFRPNIVLQGLEPFAEHRVTGLRSENCELEFRHPCQRCVVTTINQDTAVKNEEWEPYKTLRDINPMPGNEKAPAFAQNATLKHGERMNIKVGDWFEVGI